MTNLIPPAIFVFMGVSVIVNSGLVMLGVILIMIGFYLVPDHFYDRLADYFKSKCNNKDLP